MALHPKVSAVCVEGDRVWHSILAEAICSADGYVYAGAFTNVAAISNQSPPVSADMLFLDPFSQEEPPIEAFTLALEAFPKAEAFLLSARCNEVLLYLLRDKRVVGATLKDPEAKAHFARALPAIADGGYFIDEVIAAARREFQQDPDAFFKILSDREIGLLSKIGRGDSDSEISDVTGLQIGTVKSHRHHILAKLGLDNTKKLMQWAARRGFTKF